MATNTDTDVHVTYEDQMRINSFANLNSQRMELSEELELKKNELRNLEDAISELDMILDDDEKVRFQMGDVFLHRSISESQEDAQKVKKQLEEVIQSITEKCGAIQEEMSELKAVLYATFGNKINLDPDKDN